MKFLNIGILAHVDAGKTSLTERLLFNAGVITALGSVDSGNTQTDSLALERRRGITIKSAVASFVQGDTTINVLDTPGHPDFIAEVERVLSVLDGAILVISAVEGVQAQTRILTRALQRLHIPMVIFVNKIDRLGARYQSLLDEIVAKLGLDITAMGEVEHIGQVDARFSQSRRAPSTRSVPTFFGSATTGAGVETLMSALPTLLPSSQDDDRHGPSGAIFKIDRGSRGEKIAYLRMFSGAVSVREKLAWGKITAMQVFRQGQTTTTASLMAGEIGKIWGLEAAHVGDVLGGATNAISTFALPTLEAAVVAQDVNRQPALHAAIKQLAEQDPLINLRQSDQQLYVSLYGEVQKEVISATLVDDFGVAALFKRTRPICIERPNGVGYAVQFLQEESNPTSATVGLRIEPSQPGSGIVCTLDVQPRFVPLHIYKTGDNFVGHMEQCIRNALQHGLYGLEVTDCAVTITDCDYYVGDGMGKPVSDTPKTTAADFRKLTPSVLRAALQQASTVICEPICHFALEIPGDALSKVLQVLAQLRATPHSTVAGREVYLLEGRIPSARVYDLQRQLPGLTGGEGLLEYAFETYEPTHHTLRR